MGGGGGGGGGGVNLNLGSMLESLSESRTFKFWPPFLDKAMPMHMWSLYLKILLFLSRRKDHSKQRTRGGHSHTHNESIRDRGQSEVKGSTSFSR